MYQPEVNRSRNGKLREGMLTGLGIYAELLKLGFDDRTLRESLGMAYASLDLDGVPVQDRGIVRLGPLQIYRDALNETLRQLSKHSNHSYDLLEQISWSMTTRGLATHYEWLAPSDEKSFQARLRVVEQDLDAIGLRR
jgi:hypothetical protein